MPELITDDGPRKLRNVWLGPKGLRLPVEYTYTHWLMLAILLPLTVFVVGGVATGLFTLLGVKDSWYIGLLTSPFALLGAVLLVQKVAEHLSFETPFGYLHSATTAEWRESEVHAADTDTTAEVRVPTIEPVSYWTASAMRWPTDECPPPVPRERTATTPRRRRGGKEEKK